MATDRINESDAAITGAAERLARLNKELVALSNQREVVAAQQTELTDLLARDREALSELNARGPSSPDEPVAEDGPDLEAERLDAAVEAARERELDIRVTLERITEQVRHLELQAADLRREADEVEVALAEAARRREARRAGIARCGTLAATCAPPRSSTCPAPSTRPPRSATPCRPRCVPGARRSASLARGCRRPKASWPRSARSATRPTSSAPTWTTTSTSSPSG